jgi:hypothetical protein
LLTTPVGLPARADSNVIPLLNAIASPRRHSSSA